MEWSTPVPQLAVFGTDFVLWPFLINLHYIAPFLKNSSGEIYDTKGNEIPYNEDIPEIFQKLQKNGIKIGVISRRGDIKGTEELINLFGWDTFFTYKEVYASEEIETNFAKLREKSGIEYNDMLFIDEWHGHVKDAERIGVFSKPLTMDMTFFFFEECIEEYRKWKHNLIQIKKT